MPERKINLEEIFNNNFDCYTEFGLKLECIDEQPALTKDKFKELCLEFGKQLLELAAENANVEIFEEYDKYKETYIIESAIVNKQSIINTIKQIE